MPSSLGVSASMAWNLALMNVLSDQATEIHSRGMKAMEIPHSTQIINMRMPVLTSLQRHLSYRFMAAEAYWILTGDNKVENIAPYNPNISKFSDDGVIFAGAYGPRILEQLNYVITTLINDPESRQAGLTIWMPNPRESKDIPCTVALWFRQRGRALDCHAFMRSSDIWLGWPYDVFNFSMLAHLVCCYLNKVAEYPTVPRDLYLTAASSHVYEENIRDAIRCRAQPPTASLPAPEELFLDDFKLLWWLKELRNARVGDKLRWWDYDNGA